MKLLNENQVEYLLIGGYAVGYYGYPRFTADMDIWIAMNRSNAEKILVSLREFGFDVPELTEEMFLQPDRIIRMGVPPVRLEITTTISGVDFNICYAEKVLAEIDGIKVNLISLENLKTNKKASGRYKDLNDLEHLP